MWYLSDLNFDPPTRSVRGAPSFRCVGVDRGSYDLSCIKHCISAVDVGEGRAGKAWFGGLVEHERVRGS
jgi:hypothetical protein